MWFKLEYRDNTLTFIDLIKGVFPLEIMEFFIRLGISKI